MGGSAPTVSPDGNWVAYQYPNGGIARIPAGGGAPDTLCTFGMEPDWGHVGTLIVFRHEMSLYTVDAETKTTALIRSGGFDDEPDWSPDLGEIVVQSSPFDGLTIVEYPDGGITSIPCTDPDGWPCSGESPTWSPDGQWIAFYGSPLLIVPRSGGVATALTQTGGGQPHWSPDGHWIAHVKQGPGYVFHIWVTDARGYTFGTWPVTDGDSSNLSPAWGPDSRTLFFQSDRSGTTEIWKVEFEPTATEQTSWGSIKARYP